MQLEAGNPKDHKGKIEREAVWAERIERHDSDATANSTSLPWLKDVPRNNFCDNCFLPNAGKTKCILIASHEVVDPANSANKADCNAVGDVYECKRVVDPDVDGNTKHCRVEGTGCKYKNSGGTIDTA